MVSKHEDANLLDGIIDFGDKPLWSHKKSNQKSQKCSDYQLRNIIKKKLLENDEKDRTPLFENKKQKDEKKQINNRYHQLLNQFYGGPTDFGLKNRRHTKSKEIVQ